MIIKLFSWLTSCCRLQQPQRPLLHRKWYYKWKNAPKLWVSSDIDHLDNNPELDALKTVEMNVDFRKVQPHLPPHPVWLSSLLCGVLLVPGNHHYSWPQMGAEHRLPHQRNRISSCCSRRCSTCQRQWWWTSTLPSSSPSSPLPSSCDSLPPSRRQAAACHQVDCWEGGSLQSAAPPGPAVLQDSYAGKITTEPSDRLLDLLPSGRRLGPSGPEPPAPGTASSWLLQNWSRTS